MDNIKIINDELEFLCRDVSQCEGFETPTTRDVFIDPPEREGSLFIGEIAGMRQMAWRGLIRSDIQDNRRLLSRVCQPGGLKTLQFELCDGLEVQIDATVKLTSVYSKTRSPYMITAKAPYPYFQSIEEHSVSTGVTVRQGGLPIPAAIPAPIGEGGGAPYVVVNAGDIFARPVFEIKGPGTNFTITNTTTGQSIELETTLGSNEIVTIDTVTNDVLQGIQNLFGLITRTPTGEWIILEPGNNNIVFSATNDFNESTLLTVRWRDTYSGF